MTQILPALPICAAEGLRMNQSDGPALRGDGLFRLEHYGHYGHCGHCGHYGHCGHCRSTDLVPLVRLISMSFVSFVSFLKEHTDIRREPLQACTLSIGTALQSAQGFHYGFMS